MPNPNCLTLRRKFASFSAGTTKRVTPTSEQISLSLVSFAGRNAKAGSVTLNSIAGPTSWSARLLRRMSSNQTDTVCGRGCELFRVWIGFPSRTQSAFDRPVYLLGTRKEPYIIPHVLARHRSTPAHFVCGFCTYCQCYGIILGTTARWTLFPR